MPWSTTLRDARQRSGMSLRALAAAASTSHSTLAAYEAGRVTPGVDTFNRILFAAGVEAVLDVRPRIDSPRAVGDDGNGARSVERGVELREALELAELFPARHSPTMSFPIFPVLPVVPAR